MIGRVYRGGRVAGLVRYLYGPGRHNEHLDPHLVACWRGSQPSVLAETEPALLAAADGDRAAEGGGARRDVAALVAELEAPLRLREALTGTPAGPRVVWHCPLRVADGDAELSDAQWAEVAEDLLRRTGLHPGAGGRGPIAGDPDAVGARESAGCRWVAVRHDAVSIHVVVLLAREDGSAANPRFDYRRVRETCLAAEQRHGLQVTAPIDGTATPATTRAETEKAGRGGTDSNPRTRVSGEPARVALRREVRRCAITADSETEFLVGLRRRGLVVRERHSTLPPVPSPTGTRADSDSDSDSASASANSDVEPQVTGYAVGLPGDRDAVGEPVLYSGGRLGPDLTLPRLRQRWAEPPGSGSTGSGTGQGDRVAALRAAALEATAARLALHGLAGAGASDGARGVEQAVLAATGDALLAVALSVEGPLRGPLTQAAAHYERAGRLPRPTPNAAVPSGHALSRAARDLARTGTARPGTNSQAALELVRALVRLTDAVARLHAQRDRPHAARAADLTAHALRDWHHQAIANPATAPASAAARQPTRSGPAASPRATAPRGRSR